MTVTVSARTRSRLQGVDQSFCASEGTSTVRRERLARRAVCTGDWVAVEAAGNPRYVRTYLPRRTAFVRSTCSKCSEGQILAANVDYAVVAVSLAVELDLGRNASWLLAWESAATCAAARSG
jgi:hypothetical protein